MAEVYDLRREIREFIHHPRRRDPLLKDTPNWNQLASSFDVVADTEMAITSYQALPDERDDKGYLYLTIYGLLQAMYVQQDAVESLLRAFKPKQTPAYKIESEPEAAEIRVVRNDAIGHPTVQGSVKSKTGVQTSQHIVQYSMSKGGFTMMTTFADGHHKFQDVDLAELIEKNRAMVERVLRRIKDELEAVEMEHRKQFRDEKLVNIFPATMDYQFEKVYEGVRKLGTGHREFGRLSLNVIIDYLNAFRAALTKRNILNESSNLNFHLEEVQYPLDELEAYFKGNGSLKDSRAASIFAHFTQEKMHGLVKIAQEIDEEYAEELGAGN